MKKLIPALVLLLISAMVLVTASYAWFSMNNKVTVTGMEVKTKVSSNLLIAEDAAGSTSKKTDEYFKSSLTQTVKGILEPVSTANAVNFFYTVDAKADGDRTTSAAVIYPYDPSAAASDAIYKDKFSEVYGVTKSAATATYDEKASAYVDYVFQLKATNTSDGDQAIVVTKLELTYTGSGEVDNNTAYRVAFFVEDITDSASAATLTAADSQYKVTSSANFNNEVIKAATPATQTAPYLTSAAALVDSIDNTKPHYYKITVRMWLEGQDTTCNNTTFMPLTGVWALDIELSMVKPSDVATVGVYTVTMK